MNNPSIYCIMKEFSIPALRLRFYLPLICLILVSPMLSAQISPQGQTVVANQKLINLCKKADLLPKDFPLSALQKTVIVQNQVLLTFDNHESLANAEDDPYVSLFLLIEKNKIAVHHWQYAVDLDDADLAVVAGRPVFSYYSSPVGYTEYFFLGAEVLKTHKLDEEEIMDWSKLDLDKQTYRVKDSKEQFVLQKTTGD
jgi:hypothetical protein